MKTSTKLLLFALCLPIFALWLWAVSLPYFEFTRIKQVVPEKRTYVKTTDWPHTRYLPDILVYIDRARRNGNMTHDMAKQLREEAYVHRVKSFPGSPIFWRELSNFYYAYNQPEAAKIASSNAERSIGLYYPSLRIMARHYLLHQDKQAAARVLRKLIAVNIPSDIKEIHNALLNVYSYDEIITDVLPYYQDDQNLDDRIRIVNHLLSKQMAAGGNENLVGLVNALIRNESKATLRKFLQSGFFRILHHTQRYDLLVKIIKSAGYTAQYPNTTKIDFSEQGEVFCNEEYINKTRQIEVTRSSEKFSVQSDNYRDNFLGALRCYLPIDPTVSDLLVVKSVWQSLYNEQSKDYLKAWFEFRMLNSKQSIKAYKENKTFSESLEKEFTMEKGQLVFELAVKFELKASVVGYKPVELSVQPVEIKSKLR